MNLFAKIPKFCLAIAISIMVILIPISNSALLMNGIQTAKSFNFFYCVLALAVATSLALLLNKGNTKFRFTIIDFLLLAFVAWVSVNKYIFHGVHALSLRYYELIGLLVLYAIVRTLNAKFTTFLLAAVCVAGAVQAVYGNLQLWGVYPSHHGLFKMTGSFFNPGPFAGFLAGVLPVALGLYWMNKGYKLQVSSYKSWFRNFRLQISGYKFQVPGFMFTKVETDVNINTSQSEIKVHNAIKNSHQAFIGEAQPDPDVHRDCNLQPVTTPQPATCNLQPVILTALGLITVLAILLVLPAARSRAAWLGAIAGVAYLAWHRYNLNSLLKSFITGGIKSPLSSFKTFRFSFKNNTLCSWWPLWLNPFKTFRFLVVNPRSRKWLTISLLLIVVLSAGAGLYHFKKDSADGRMLIWTVTANIIKDYPLLGVGQDRFKAHYMDYQADYFRKHPNSKYELVADANQYAFNEALNTWAENGLVGLLLGGGLVWAIFGYRLQVSGFRLLKGNYKLQDTGYKLQVSGFKFAKGETDVPVINNQPIPEDCLNSNLNRSKALDGEAQPDPDGHRDSLKLETILRASLLAILVFGMFAYPSEILPTKIIATVCLALLAGTTIPLLKSEAKSFVPFVKKPLRPLWLKPLLFRISLVVVTLFAVVLLLPPIKKMHGAYVTWNYAFELYNCGLYTECLKDYEKALQLLQHNGEFMNNYGKALSIAKKHKEAIEILEQTKRYLTNSVFCTAMGESQKALKEYESAEKYYWQASNMAPCKFYPQYLLAILYDETNQKQKAIAIATSLLKKEIKIESIAIEEIHDEMGKIIERNTVGELQILSNKVYTNIGQKGRNNHTSPQKTLMVTLPEALSIKQSSTVRGANKTERR